MKRILLDTNAYTAFKTGTPDAVQVFRIAETIGFSTIVLGELLSGFAAGGRAAENRRELTELLDSPRVSIFTADETTAEYYAHTYLHLRRKGAPIPTNDLWIAATALQHGLAVFTYDKHFLEVDGLLVGSRPEDFMP
ncbi:type II toxin-antitoxin system VapC family toxin [Fodinibius sp.]|uniref:type II toxin-antitoxin system VapC family toxin n=1 Tax=Fodinibius sp. TaxID=1872440 RepID=UPI002ACE0AF8|nr:type II toxin-antitoxin system VapC family toxin [Fodinibius sp.]MDZ7659450.1 type II toxin-antitoxin system VapC family toxin [Fodinibius sp.]